MPPAGSPETRSRYGAPQKPSLAAPQLSEGSAVARVGWSASHAARCPLSTVGSAFPYPSLARQSPMLKAPQLPDEPLWQITASIEPKCRVASGSAVVFLPVPAARLDTFSFHDGRMSQHVFGSTASGATAPCRTGASWLVSWRFAVEPHRHRRWHTCARVLQCALHGKSRSRRTEACRTRRWRTRPSLLGSRPPDPLPSKALHPASLHARCPSPVAAPLRGTLQLPACQRRQRTKAAPRRAARFGAPTDRS